MLRVSLRSPLTLPPHDDHIGHTWRTPQRNRWMIKNTCSYVTLSMQMKKDMPRWRSTSPPPTYALHVTGPQPRVGDLRTIRNGKCDMMVREVELTRWWPERCRRQPRQRPREEVVGRHAVRRPLPSQCQPGGCPPLYRGVIPWFVHEP